MRPRRTILAAGLLVWLAATANGASLLERASNVDSAIETHVAALLQAALTDDAAGADTMRERLAGADIVRREAGAPPTGLVDQAGLLVAGTARTRDGRRAALEALLDDRPDTVVAGLAEHWLATDDAAHASQLLVDDRHNRRVHVLNDAIRPFGLTSSLFALAAVNPFLLAGSAIDSIATTASNLWHYNRLSTREREALVRYRTQLARDTATADTPEIAAAVTHLDAKRLRARCDDTRAALGDALERHHYDRARFLLREADALPDCPPRVRKPRERLARELAQQATADDEGRWPVAEPRLPETADEAAAYDRLLRVLGAADADATIREASTFTAGYPTSPLRDHAQFAKAVGDDLAGHRATAREGLHALSDPDTGVGRAALALETTPEISGLDGMAQAERRHRLDVARFVLIGDTIDGRTAVYTAAHLGAQGAQAATSLGILNVIGIAGRAWQAWRHDPASNDTIIARGEAFLGRTPTAPEAPEVHDRLADAYERAENPARALMHYRATRNPDPERIAELESDLADQILADARDDRLVLESLVQRFPLTDAGAEARTRLAELPGSDELPVTREVLLLNPPLLGPRGFDLDPTLLDGDGANRELAERGIAVGPDRLTIYLDDVDAPEIRELSPDAAARLRDIALDALWRGRVVIAERDPDVGVWEKYIPVFLQGSIGGDGSVAVAPGLKLRRYRNERPELYQ